MVGAFVPIFISSFYKDSEVWPHLIRYVLPRSVFNTFFLIFSVGLVTLFVGTLSGWICSQYEFRGRQWISQLLVIPLGIPAYVLAFVYLGLFDFAGEWRLWLLERGWVKDFYIQGGWGACFILSLSLYPYVYLFSYMAFQTQGHRWREVAQSLGHSRWSSFFKLEWGVCRPWILGALVLVSLEVVADFGAVVMFNFDTLSTSIYKVWFGMHSWSGASQLASLLLIFILFLKFLDFQRQNFSQNKRYHLSESLSASRSPLSMGWQVLVYLFFGSLIFLSFILPVFQLLQWFVFSEWESGQWKSWGSYIQSSFFFGFLGAIFIAFFSFLLAYSLRVNRGFVSQFSQKVISLGYALPGTVLAVGVLGFSLFLEISTDSSLMLSLLMVFVAYAIRFQTLGLSQLSSAFQRLPRQLDESANLLGASDFSLIQKVHFPLVKKSILASGLLIFIEIVKEMPLTLMLRPFGWDTLAVKIFEFTSEGDWEKAALPALLIISLGVFASVFVQRNLFGRT